MIDINALLAELEAEDSTTITASAAQTDDDPADLDEILTGVGLAHMVTAPAPTRIAASSGTDLERRIDAAIEHELRKYGRTPR